MNGYRLKRGYSYSVIEGLAEEKNDKTSTTSNTMGHEYIHTGNIHRQYDQEFKKENECDKEKGENKS